MEMMLGEMRLNLMKNSDSRIFSPLNFIGVDFITVEMPVQETDQIEPFLLQPENNFSSPSPDTKPRWGLNVPPLKCRCEGAVPILRRSNSLVA